MFLDRSALVAVDAGRNDARPLVRVGARRRPTVVRAAGSTACSMPPRTTGDGRYERIRHRCVGTAARASRVTLRRTRPSGRLATPTNAAGDRRIDGSEFGSERWLRRSLPIFRRPACVEPGGRTRSALAQSLAGSHSALRPGCDNGTVAGPVGVGGARPGAGPAPSSPGPATARYAWIGRAALAATGTKRMIPTQRTVAMSCQDFGIAKPTVGRRFRSCRGREQSHRRRQFQQSMFADRPGYRKRAECPCSWPSGP